MNAEPSVDPRLAAIQAGDGTAFDDLVTTTQRPLFAFAWRYLHNHADAEEAVIETFVRLHRARARLRADTKLSAWLFTTLANLCHNRHRWRTRHPETSLDAPPDPGTDNPMSGDAPDALLEHDEAAAALRSAIAALPHDQRTVVLLHHYEHLSYRDIGAVVGCTERGVETRLYRARQQLRSELAGYLRETMCR